MLDVEPLIVGELCEVAALDRPDGMDWDDVLRRAGSASRSDVRWVRVLLVAAVLLLVAAPALAFRHEVIDFLTASHAPRSDVNEFGRLQVTSFPGSAPDVLPHQARRVMTIHDQSGTTTLSVAPTRYGGYCDLWSTNGVECLPRRSQARIPGGLGTFSYGWYEAQLGVNMVQGSVLRNGATVTLHYADRTTTDVSYVWVTAPIRAGFFLYRVPAGHASSRTRPVALTVQWHGHQLGRETIVDPTLSEQLVSYPDRWGHYVQAPAEAVWAKRRLLETFMEKNGTLVEFWVMPSRRGTLRRCFVASPLSMGCLPAVLSGDLLQLQIFSGTDTGTVLLFGEVAANVAQVKLRFEDGRTQRISPKDGFLLMRLDPTHYPRQHRLATATAVGANHRTLFVQRFRTSARDVYPCFHPKNYGYGVRQCP
jgi:hypothetical protein